MFREVENIMTDTKETFSGSPCGSSSLPQGVALDNNGGSDSAPKTKRTRWLEGKLYCDNPYHVTLLGYFVNCGFYQGVYIKHDKDTDENGKLKKPHWHIVLYDANNLRSCCRVGGGRYVAKNWCKSFGTFDAVVNSSDGKVISYLAAPCAGASDCLPVGTSVKTFPLITDFAAINDVPVFLAYLTHSDFKSCLAGKYRYPVQDLCFIGESPTVKAAFGDGENRSCGLMLELYTYTLTCNTPFEMLTAVLADDRLDLAEYIRKNPHFVSKFFFNSK